MKKIAITGCTGQVGSTATKRFLKEGWEVIGLKRRSSSHNTERLDDVFNDPNLHLVYGDITDASSINDFVADAKPDVFLNCAAQSHVAVSFPVSSATLMATGNSVLYCLDAIKKHCYDKRFITMSSSEMYGSNVGPSGKQDINTPFKPNSPYAVAKLTGFHLTRLYRECYSMDCWNAICFNIEGPNRGPTFVTKKISNQVARISLGLADKLYLGDISTHRDWTFCENSVDCLFRMATTDKPANDYIIASGHTHSIEEFCEKAFAVVGLDYKDYVISNTPQFMRPKEVEYLCGDASKTTEDLGWKPTVGFDELVKMMVEHDLKLAQQELLIKNSQLK